MNRNEAADEREGMRSVEMTNHEETLIVKYIAMASHDTCWASRASLSAVLMHFLNSSLVDGEG